MAWRWSFRWCARKNSRVFCSGCGRPGPAYDRLEERRFEFVPSVGDLGVPGLSDAAGELQAVRGDRRDGAVVRRQEPTDDDLPLVSGDLGQEAELERGRLDLPDVVGQRLSGGGARRRMGPGPSGPEQGDGLGRGRDRLGPRPHVFDAGLRHRRRDEATVGRGRRADRGEPAVVPGGARRDGLQAGEVRVQRHVEAVPQGDRRETRSGGPRAGPVPRDAEVRQGAGRDPGGGVEAVGSRRLRAGLEEVAVVLPEASGEPDGQADREAVGAPAVQPADGAGVPAPRGVPAALGVQECVVGGESSWTSGRRA